MIRKFLVILGNLGVLAAFIAVMMIMGALRPQAERQEPVSIAPTVFVEEVEYAPMRLRVAAQGEVRPKQEIMLTPQVGGKIVMVADDFAGGGVIDQGQVLVQLEDADYRLAVTRARAQVATARQALEIEKAESELARRDYEELNSASENGDPSDLTLRRPQLARAEAEYQAALANLQDAELGLERTKIRAPFTGRVRSISANLGQFVWPGMQLGEIFSTDVAEIRLPLTDDDLAKLNLPLAFNDEELGPEVTLSTVAAGRTRNWTGRITRVDAAVDATTRQIAAIVEVEDPYGRGADDGFPLAVGLYVDAEIEGPMLERATVVPRIAIQDGDTVYTIDDENKVQQQTVVVAAYSGDGAIITDGLDPGERVVVSRLNASVGSEVRPLDPDNPQEVEEAPSEEDDGARAQANAASNSGGGAGGGAQK